MSIKAIVNTDTYDLTEEYTIDSYNKMNNNMSLYYNSDINTNMPLFLKSVEIPDYIYGEKNYTTRDSDVNRLDNVSYKYYGTPELFWVIMLVNNIVDPFDIPTGTVLRILPKEYVVYNILKKKEEELF